MNIGSRGYDSAGFSMVLPALSVKVSLHKVDENHINKLLLPRGIYLHLCPNCGGPIEDSRLLFKNACSKCMGTNEIIPVSNMIELTKHVKEVFTESSIRKVVDVQKFVHDFSEFFVKCLKSSPWHLQISWAVRIAQNQSFALIAPTGVGKTTFGLIVALYLSYRLGKKAYIIVPTSILVKQCEERLREFAERAGIIVQIIAMHSKLSPKKREEYEKAIREGYFDIIITTSKYLMRNFNDVFNEFLSKGYKIDFVFVDDVDAVMKGSKAIDMILKLIGFGERDIEKAYKLMALRQRVMKCDSSENEKTRGMCYEGEKHIRDIFNDLQREILATRRKCGILVISSATGRARGKRIRLFRELLGFNIGSAVEVYRNVVDTYMLMPKEEEVADIVAKLINKLGDGCLIYVTIDRGLEYANKLCNELRDRGIDVEVLSSRRTDTLERFILGEIKALIGVATYYGLLVRGIDIPERIRYAIFIGVPRHKISITQIGFNPQNLLRLLTVLLDVIEDEKQKDKAIRLIAQLRRILRQMSAERIKIIVDKISSQEPIEEPIASIITEAHNFVTSLLSDKNIVEALKKYQKASIVEENNTLYILIPDAPTYIQASGRTSRLFVGGITTGLSIVLVDDIRLLNGLVDRVKYFIEDFSMSSLETVDIDNVIKRIDDDRELLKAIRSGKLDLREVPKELRVRTALFIVESPNKARTIASFFGRPTFREIDGLRIYETNVGDIHLLITSTGGHVFELVEEGIQEDSVYGIAIAKHKEKTLFLPKYDYIKRCLRCGTQFVKGETCPICGSDRVKSSRSVIEVLQKIAMEVDEIFIATDPDAEGEKIGYDIAISLAPFAKSIMRIEFHEVTRKAVMNAFRNPREVNLSLVEAQITRRIEDRLLGFALSEYVTNKLKTLDIGLREREGRLSAGRVQTPVLGRIIELYIKKLTTARKTKIIYLDGISIEVPQDLLEKALGEEIKRLSPSRVEVVFRPISVSIERLYPLPPFTTDEMIAEAHRVLKIDAVEAMRLAQDLFELGFITYHRTDSTRISSAGIGVAKEYISSIYGDKLSEVFEPRTWGSGGAHEGIRPTKPIDVDRLKELIAEGIIETPLRLTAKHFKLYDLIFRRFMASQMKPGIVEKTRYIATVYIDNNEVFSHTIELVTNVIDPGFLLMYMPIKVISVPNTTFSLKPLKIRTVVLSEYTMPTQGDIIRWMKEVGIGRPSTYAKIIDTIIKRGYTMSVKGGILIPDIEGIYVYLLLAGASFDDKDIDFEMFLNTIRSVYRRSENIVENVTKILNMVRNELRRMVSVKRTQELYTKIQAVESGKVNYIDVIQELFKEVCKHVISELYGEGVKVCQTM
ncbi:MAG: reverse gyrase [Ignisphaera sp.]